MYLVFQPSAKPRNPRWRGQLNSRQDKSVMAQAESLRHFIGFKHKSNCKFPVGVEESVIA